MKRLLPLVLLTACFPPPVDVLGKTCALPAHGCGRGAVCHQNVCAAELIPLSGTWRYLDNGVDPGAAWLQPGFDDGAWREGEGPFGYDTSVQRTTIGFGPDKNNKYITTWFRRHFEAASAYSSLPLTLRVDDGAVLYLNGTELGRSNMPAGPVDSTTPAVLGLNEAELQPTVSVEGSPKTLVIGDNVLAVEVHQHAGITTDMIFDLSLLGAK